LPALRSVSCLEILAMKTRVLIALAALLSVAPTFVAAQGSTTAPAGASSRREMSAERRDEARARREKLAAMTPEQRDAQRAEMRARAEARLSAMPPEQQQFVRDLRTYQQGLRETAKGLREQVTAGTLTRDQMAQQLKAYRDANRPARPAGMPSRKPAP
jgi:hypothetical protein